MMVSTTRPHPLPGPLSRTANDVFRAVDDSEESETPFHNRLNLKRKATYNRSSKAELSQEPPPYKKVRQEQESVSLAGRVALT